MISITCDLPPDIVDTSIESGRDSSAPSIFRLSRSVCTEGIIYGAVLCGASCQQGLVMFVVGQELIDLFEKEKQNLSILDFDKKVMENYK